MGDACDPFIWKEIFEFLNVRDCLAVLLCCKQWSLLAQDILVRKKNYLGTFTVYIYGECLCCICISGSLSMRYTFSILNIESNNRLITSIDSRKMEGSSAL